MSHNLSAELLNELQDVFNKFSLENDGNISATELRYMMRAVGMEPTEAELHDLFRTVDEDKDSSIDLHEFLQFMAPRLREIESEENLRHAFETFNRSGYGFFDAQDLRIVMGNFGEILTDDECALLFGDMDAKHQQRIHLSEFIFYIRQGETHH